MGRAERRWAAIFTVALATAALFHGCDRDGGRGRGTATAPGRPTQAAGPDGSPAVALLPEGAREVDGVLAPSALFAGGPGRHKRYTLSNPDTRLIAAYVRCTTGEVNLARHVGETVRVTGVEVYDPDVRHYVLEARRVVPLLPPIRPDQPTTQIVGRDDGPATPTSLPAIFED